MTATVCRWALQEHKTGVFVESQFVPEENTLHHTYFLRIFDGLDPQVVTAIIAQIASVIV